MISHNFLLLTAVKLELATIEIFAKKLLGGVHPVLSSVTFHIKLDSN